MSFQNHKITQTNISERKGLSPTYNAVREELTRLIGTAEENKSVFDRMPSLIIEHLNGLIDSLDEQSVIDANNAHVWYDEDYGSTGALIISPQTKEDFEDAVTATYAVFRTGSNSGEFSILSPRGDSLFKTLYPLHSVAEGNTTTASGYYSHAEGQGTTASSYGSHAEGVGTKSSGYASHAEGVNTEASNYTSHAEGYDTSASGGYSHAEGCDTKSSGEGAHAEGYDTSASGGYSHAEGYDTSAGDTGSHAEGYGTKASGVSSHAQNYGTIASKKAQTALGRYNVADTDTSGDYGKYAVIVGNGKTLGNRSNALTVDWEGNVEASGDVTDGTGNVLSQKADTADIPTKTSDLTNDSNFVSDASYVHTDNNYTTTEKTKLAGVESGAEVNVQSDWNQTTTTADDYIKNKPAIKSGTGTNSVVEGDSSAASGSRAHAEGFLTTASGNQSHAEGEGTTASGGYSHAEGYETEARGIMSHAEGEGTTASGGYSHAEGYETEARGIMSHAQNENTVVYKRAQTALGRYNIADTNNGDYGKYAVIVGNGTQNNRSNALTVDWEGNVEARGDVTDGLGNKLSDIPTKTSDLINDSNFVSDASYVHTDSNYTTAEKSKLAGIEAGAEKNQVITVTQHQLAGIHIADIDIDGATTEIYAPSGGGGGGVQSDWSQTDPTQDDYIKNKPSIPTKTSDLTNDSNYVSDASYVHTDNNYTASEKSKLAGIEAGAEENVQSNWNQTDSTADDYIKNKPTIPTKTSDLTNDSNFVSDASYVHTDNNYTASEKTKLAGIETGAEVNVQSDWNQTTTTSDDFIKNKPAIKSGSGDYSIVEGNGTTASGNTSHAEGFSVLASGDISHAEGCNTLTIGDYSHAQNEYTYAMKKAQTTLGRYNIADTNSGDYGKYAVIVGNGSYGERSNALTVDWDGNVLMSLDTTATTGTIDGDLYDAITDLGWEGVVLENA